MAIVLLALCHTMSQEVAGGQKYLCASVVLDGQPELLQQRIANQIYESCRAKQMDIPGFPDYDPVIEALRESSSNGTMQEVNYKVCIAKPGGLVVLQSLARRWLEYDGTKEMAKAMIESHNNQYNAGGDFVEDDERSPTLSNIATICFKIFLQ